MTEARWRQHREKPKRTAQDAVHPALERVEDDGVRTVGAAFREGGGDSRGGADVARLWVAAQLRSFLRRKSWT